MSNGDDVLDNWEEIDEVGLNSKLNKLQEERKSQQNKKEENDKFFNPSESGENFRLQLSQKQQQVETEKPSPLDDMSSFQNTIPLMMVLHKPDDEYQSANYVQPTKSQTVKILRRPTQSTDARGNGMRPKQPIKTLQQREQEYAEARLRILGSAKNPEDDVETSLATPTTKLPSETTNNIHHKNAGNGGTTALWQCNFSDSGATVGGVIESTAFGGHVLIPQSSQNLRHQQQENVLRMPKGPDGSVGFQTRR